MNRTFDAKLKVIWAAGCTRRKASKGLSAYSRLCARYGLAVLLTAGVMAIVAAFAHVRTVSWLAFAAEMFIGSAIVLALQWRDARAARRQHDCTCSCEEESA